MFISVVFPLLSSDQTSNHRTIEPLKFTYEISCLTHAFSLHKFTSNDLVIQCNHKQNIDFSHHHHRLPTPKFNNLTNHSLIHSLSITIT